MASEPRSLHLAESGFVVQLRRMRGARRLTLRVRSAKRDAILTVPARTSLEAARAFAERHQEWLRGQFSKLPQPVVFADGAELPFRGVIHRIEGRPGERGLPRAEPGQGGPARLVVPGLPEQLPRRLRAFLEREAKRDLTAAVERHAGTLGVSVGRLRLGDPTSRWGSCSPRGGLSFSWRLILAPPEVLDYLAAHEVAHRREMNHGPRFWAVVAGLRPDYKIAEAWLRRQGTDLHRYGGPGTPPQTGSRESEP